MNTDEHRYEYQRAWGCSGAASCDWIAQSFGRKGIPITMTVSRPNADLRVLFPAFECFDLEPTFWNSTIPEARGRDLEEGGALRKRSCDPAVLVEVSDYVSVSAAVGRLEKRAENEKFFKKLLNNTLAQIENR